jgi:hypothetical protein
MPFKRSNGSLDGAGRHDDMDAWLVVTILGLCIVGLLTIR